MILEISYTYQKDKDSEIEHSWTYFHTAKKDFSKASVDAEKYFKSFIRSSGWTKQTKFIEISVIRNESEASPIVRTVAEPKPKQSRSKGTLRKSTSSSKKQSSQTKKSRKKT